MLDFTSRQRLGLEGQQPVALEPEQTRLYLRLNRISGPAQFLILRIKRKRFGLLSRASYRLAARMQISRRGPRLPFVRAE